MFGRATIFLCSALVLGLLIVPMASGAGESELILEISITSMTPIYMSGHSGDANWIEGYNGAGNINMSGSKVGTLTATIRLFNPPSSLTERYDYGLIKIVHTLTGLGSFEFNGKALTMGSSTTTTAGDVTFSWSGSISNGTSSLSGVVGQVAGAATANMFTGTGTGKEIVLYRAGY